MGPKAVATARRKSGRPDETHGRAFAFGRLCFLAFIGLTPIAIVALPRQAGVLALFHAYDPTSLPKTVAFLALCGLSVASLCIGLVRREEQLRWHPLLWILLALVGWTAVSAVFSTSWALSVWGSSTRNDGLLAVLGYGLVAFLGVQYVRSTMDLRTVAVVAVVSGSLASAYAVLQYFGLDPLPWTQVWRVVSTFGNADMFGDYVLFPLMLALGLALSASDGRGRILSWSAVALMTAALAASETRGAWIGAAAALACVVTVSWRRVRDATRAQRWVVAGVAALIVASLAAVFVSVRPRAASSASSLSSAIASLSNGRTVIWLTGLRGWLARPIFGWGPDAFQRAFEHAVGSDWYAVILPTYASADNAHSVVVQLLVTLGVPGLVLALGALGYAAARSYRGLRAPDGTPRTLLIAVWAALIGMFVALLFGVSVPAVNVWLWLAAGLLVAPSSHEVELPDSSAVNAAFVAASALGVMLAVWASSWLVADVAVGRSQELPAGPQQVAALEFAVRLNPLAQGYRGLLADALASEAQAQQRSGQSQQAEGTMAEAVSAYEAAVAADPADLFTHVALASVLTSYAATHPQSDVAQRAVEVALEAAKLAPHDVVVLVTLARAYEVAGDAIQAEQAARLARSVAPAYAMQALGSLGASQ